MRIVLAFVLLALAFAGNACQTATPEATTRPGVAQPPGPMDTVTNPMNQPTIDRTGALH